MTDYTGSDNLEVMAEALNYNRYLSSLVVSHAVRDESIIDFGAGIGTFAIDLAQKGYRVHCIERDHKQAAVISAAGLSVLPSLEEINNCTVDYIYALNVLEHIEDDLTALRHMYDKLRPGGKLLVYVPAFDLLFSSMDRKVGHHRRYTAEILTSKLRTAKFHVVSARYVDSIGFFVSLYYRFFGNGSGKLNRNALRFYDRFVFPISKRCDSKLQFFFGKNLAVLACK